MNSAVHRQYAALVILTNPSFIPYCLHVKSLVTLKADRQLVLKIVSTAQKRIPAHGSFHPFETVTSKDPTLLFSDLREKREKRV